MNEREIAALQIEPPPPPGLEGWLLVLCLILVLSPIAGFYHIVVYTIPALSRAFSREEFGRRQMVHVQGLPLFFASAEDIVIAKLEWSKVAQSRRQIEDVATILRLRWESLARLNLEKWISNLNLNQEWSDAKGIAGVI